MSPPFFLVANQGAFNAPGMDGEPEALLDLSGPLLRRDRRLLGAPGLEKAQNLGGEFMSGFGSRLARHQTLQALEGEEVFGLVNRGSRQPEISGGAAQGPAFGAEGAQGLIFDLKEVAGIKEAAGDKEGVADFVGVGMQGMAGLEGLVLGVVGWSRWHKGWGWAYVN